MEKTCIQASDVLNCVSAAITTALNDRIPYKNTPVLIEIIGAHGIGKTINQLPHIPYAGITMAGINWGISGSLARTKAEGEAVESKIETERIAGLLTGLRAIENRVAEGEALLYALAEKLKKSLGALQSLAGEETKLSQAAGKELDVSVRLIKSIKEVIETDISGTNGFLTKKSGIIFRKIKKEVFDV